MHKINLKSKNNSYGFTLIELLVVLSIIAMLVSVMYAFFGTSRARAMDTKRKIEVREVGTALRLYYENNGTMPRNFKGTIIAEEGDTYYEQSMQELVNDKVISAVPKSTDGSHYYYYYDNSKSDGECATFFTYSKMTGEPIFTGCEAVVKKLNVDKSCNASQVWNGSSCVTENPYTGPVSLPPAPNVIVDDINNTVQGMREGMEYSLDGVAYVPYNSNTFYNIDFTGNHTLLVRYSSSGNIPASYITTLTFTENTNPIVTSISPNTAVPGTLLWVYGTNFDTTNQNIVKISKESDPLIYYYYPSSPVNPIIQKIPFWLPNYPIGNYRITVNNSQYGNGVVYKTLTVTAPGTEPSVGILNPNGGETLTLGNQYTINWNANNMPPPANNLPNFSIALLNDVTGASLGFIARNLGAYATNYAWTVGRIYAESDTNLTNPITVPVGKYRIIVKSGIGRNSTSASYFTIISALIPPILPLACGTAGVAGSFGDVNLDGFISRDDLNLIINFLLGKTTLTSIQQINADTSGDRQVSDGNGNPTNNDLMYMRMYLNGQSNTFPACSI